MENFPFNVFPKKGYINTKFQIISNVNNIDIEITGDNYYRILKFDSEISSYLLEFNESGTYTLKTEINGNSFEKKIVVEDAFRFGSSEVKKIYLFDNLDFTIIIMKDRMYIYSEKIEQLFCENKISPTNIMQIDGKNLLFVTEFEDKTNLGIYNLSEFKIIGELLEKYKKLILLPNKKIVWLKNKNSIQCFKLISQNNNVFEKIIEINNITDYYIDNNKFIYINVEDKIIIYNVISLEKKIINKNKNISLDKHGFIYKIEDDNLCINNIKFYYNLNIKINNNINLDNDNLFFKGENFILTDMAIFKEEVAPFVNYEEKIEELTEIVFQNKILKNKPRQLLYPTEKGIYIIIIYDKYTLKKIIFENNNYMLDIDKEYNISLSIYFVNKQMKIKLLEKFELNHYSQIEYFYPYLFLKNAKEYFLFYNQSKNKIHIKDENIIKLKIVANKPYIFKKNTRLNYYTIYSIFKQNPILEKIYIKKMYNDIIWFSENFEMEFTKRLNYYSFSKDNVYSTKFSEFELKDFTFKSDYIYSEKLGIINPQGEIKAPVNGKIRAFSKNLDKLVTQWEENFILNKYDNASNRYKQKTIILETKKFKEAYLYPRGEKVILKSENNKYYIYDFKEQKLEKFTSGNFISFTKDNNIIVKDTLYRNAKIIDPYTFKIISSKNYEYYEFISPDGELYAETSLRTAYYDKINDRKISKYKFFDLQEKFTKDKNERKKFFQKNKKYLYKLNIYSEYELLRNISLIYSKISYLVIGSVKENISLELPIPNFLEYYNYAAFNYENDLFVCVGKPEYEYFKNTFTSQKKGIICLYRIKYDKLNKKLELLDKCICDDFPKAVWTANFSKRNYLAVYDSNPITYIYDCNGMYFPYKRYSKYKNCNFINEKKIEGKNFLCFSPSGNYMALSINGYEAVTLGGKGHQESNIVYIAKIKNINKIKIIKSFYDHGDIIIDKLVSFSENEKKILTVSKDGVVIVRNINLD